MLRGVETALEIEWSFLHPKHPAGFITDLQTKHINRIKGAQANEIYKLPSKFLLPIFSTFSHHRHSYTSRKYVNVTVNVYILKEQIFKDCFIPLSRLRYMHTKDHFQERLRIINVIK